MEKQINIAEQNTVTQPTPTQEKHKVNYWMISTIFFALLFLSALTWFFSKSSFSQQQKSGENIQAVSPTASTSAAVPAPIDITPRNNREFSAWYSVEYPINFFVTRKTYNSFGIAETRWQAEMGHIPEAGIETYTNVIPNTMSLKEWLTGVGDPNPPVQILETPKSCKEFFDTLRQQLKYGDLFNNDNLKGNGCIYFGVSDIKDTTIAGFPALEFKTLNVSSDATHTIVVSKNQSGSTLLFDLYFTRTGMTDTRDKTIDAYKLFLSTFKFRQK